jgi:hypothetical protein
MAIITAAKNNGGKDTPKKEDMNKLCKHPGAGGYKTTESNHESDSGSTDAQLSSTTSSLYSAAVSNSGKGGDKALQNR